MAVIEQQKRFLHLMIGTTVRLPVLQKKPPSIGSKYICGKPL